MKQLHSKATKNTLVQSLKAITAGFLGASLLSMTIAAPININEADVPMIVDNLSNIGPVKAAAIVEYRDANGPFSSADDLLSVKGIGEKTIEQNIDKLIFDKDTKIVANDTDEAVQDDEKSESDTSKDETKAKGQSTQNS